MVGEKYKVKTAMQRSPRNRGPGSRAGEAARKQLIRREMRFVLHQDVRRFTQQLLARLLERWVGLRHVVSSAVE